MSWSGTVTCSYCYERGHNRRSCPKITENVQREYDEARQWLANAENDPDSNNVDYWIKRLDGHAKELMKRTGVDPRTGEKVKKNNTTCGYCYEQGHNRRSCPKRKADRAAAIASTAAMRAAASEYVKARGIGVGAIIKGEIYVPGQGYTVHPCVITGVRWQDWSAVSTAAQIFTYERLAALGQNARKQAFGFDGACPQVLQFLPSGRSSRPWRHEHIELIAPLTASQVEAQIPSDWTNGHSDQINQHIK